MKTTTTRWIYYLSYNENLPMHFFKLSAELSDLGFMLLPIKPEQIHLFIQESNIPHIVTVTTNQAEFLGWKRALKTKINFFLTNKKINVYHLSSFAESKLEGRRNNHYHFMKLPCKIKLLALRLAAFYDEMKPESKQWPGGKRAKLPA